MINGKLEACEIYEVLIDEIGYARLADSIYDWFGDNQMEGCLRDTAACYRIELDEE